MIARYFDLLRQRPAVSGYRDVTGTHRSDSPERRLWIVGPSLASDRVSEVFGIFPHRRKAAGEEGEYQAKNDILRHAAKVI
jgi:hypothetical protein